MILAPQSALAWVQSTPLGREVVPEVYCTPTGAMGSAGRSGMVAGSPSMAAKAEAASGAWPAAGGAPLSWAVTASHSRSGAKRLTNSARLGWVIAALAPEWAAKYPSSSPDERALVVTATAPISAQAYQARMISGLFSRWIST